MKATTMTTNLPMLPDPVRTAPTCPPHTPAPPSRRAFLGRAASALAGASAASLGAAAALPAASPPVTAENPELVTLGEKIAPALDAYRAAKVAKAEARARAEALCPPVPAELVHDERDSRTFVEKLQCCAFDEVDVEGPRVQQPEKRGDRWHRPTGRRIYSAFHLRDGIADGWLSGSARSKQGKHVRRLIEIAEQYESARAAAIEMSGLDAADRALGAAKADVQRLAWAARDLAPVTLAGAAIQARALIAFAEAEEIGGRVIAGLNFGAPLADAIVRLAETGGRHV